MGFGVEGLGLRGLLPPRVPGDCMVLLGVTIILLLSFL